MDVTIGPGCGRTMEPGMVLNGIPGLDINMALGGGTGHSVQFHPSCRVTLGQQHDGPQVASEISGIRATDPDTDP